MSTHGLELNRGYDSIASGQHVWIKNIADGHVFFRLEPQGSDGHMTVEEFARLFKRTPPTGATHGFTTYRTWTEVMQAARAGETLYYQAPMNTYPSRFTAGKGPWTYEVKPRGIRLTPPKSAADPFTANADHLERFRRKPYAERQFEGPRSAEGVQKLLGQLGERRRTEGPFTKILEQLDNQQPPTEHERAEVQRLMRGGAHTQRYDVLRCSQGNCVHVSWYETMTQAEHEAAIVSRGHGGDEVFIEHEGKRVALFKYGSRVQ